MEIDLKEVYKKLPKEWQDWVNMWPDIVRENAILISVVAIYEDIPPTKIYRILNKHPEVSSIFSNLSYYSRGMDNKFLMKMLEFISKKFKLTRMRYPKALIAQYKKEIFGSIFDLYFKDFSLIGLEILELPPLAVLPYIKKFFEHLMEFQNTQDILYIDKAVEILRIIYHNFNENTELSITVRSNIGYLYEKKTELLGFDYGDMMRAVDIYNSLIREFKQCNKNCALIKLKLSSILIKYRNFIDVEQLEIAKDYINDALRFVDTSFAEWSILKTNLGVYYGEKFKHTQNIEYLKKSLEIFKEILGKRKTGSESWLIAQSNIEYTNLLFYKHTDFVEYLFDAIDSFYEVLDSSDKGTQIWINTKFFIGLAYLNLFDKFESIQDLESGISHVWDVLVYEDPSSYRVILTKILIGMSLLVLFGETSDISKLENALEFFRDVLKLTKKFPSKVWFFPKISKDIAEIFMEYFENGKINHSKLAGIIEISMGEEGAEFLKNAMIEEYFKNQKSNISDEELYLSLVVAVRLSYSMILKELITDF